VLVADDAFGIDIIQPLEILDHALEGLQCLFGFQVIDVLADQGLVAE